MKKLNQSQINELYARLMKYYRLLDEARRTIKDLEYDLQEAISEKHSGGNFSIIENWCITQICKIARDNKPCSSACAIYGDCNWPGKR